jgi:heat shock protein HtpX
LFEEVYEQARAKTPSLNKHIKLYITEDKTLNAFAVGRKTVMLTRGTIDSLSPEELKGCMAHELGHMANGDSVARVITIVGNGFFSVVVLVCNTIPVLKALAEQEGM